MSNILIVVWLFILVVDGGLSINKHSHINAICSGVMNSSEKLNFAERSFIYRCRQGDDCGGVGDRIGGIMGGAFYAMMTNRAFKVFWPGLEHVFKPNKLNWTYDPIELGIPILKSSDMGNKWVTNGEGNEIYQAFTSNKEVGVINDLNSRQITNSSLLVDIEQYKHIFFHSNRGPKKEMYERISIQNGWKRLSKEENEDINYYEVFRCLFDAMFKPTQNFLNSSYSAINHSLVPFSHILEIMNNSRYQTLSFHHRIDDAAAEADNSQEYVITNEDIARIVTVAEKHREVIAADYGSSVTQKKEMILFFVTNCNVSAHKIISHPEIQKTFRSVYSQKLSRSYRTHVNIKDSDMGRGESSLNSLLPRSVLLTLMHTMRDWWIMKQSDILICPNSGFSKSAALLAPLTQIKYEDAGKAYRQQPWIMCGSRFC